MQTRIVWKGMAVLTALAMVASSAAVLYTGSGAEGGKEGDEGGGGRGVISLVPPPFVCVAGAADLIRTDKIISQLEEVSEPLGPKSEIHVHKEECLSTNEPQIEHNKIYNFTTKWSASVWEVENLEDVTYTITTSKNFTYKNNWERYQNGTENTLILPPTVEGQNYSWVLPLKDRVGSNIIFALALDSPDSPETETVQDNPWVDLDVSRTNEGGYTRVNVTVVPVVLLDWINLDIRGEEIINVTTYPPEFELTPFSSNHIEFDSGEINQGQIYEFSVLVEAPEEVYLWLDTTFDWIEEPPSDAITLPVAELGSVTVRAEVPVIWEHSPTLPHYVQSIAIEFEEEEKPTVSITTDKQDYTAGETMLVNITIANPTEELHPVYFAWRLDLSDYGWQEWVAVLELDLAPGYEETFSVPFTLGDYGYGFNASWFVALYNATTFEVVAEDTAEWRFVSGERAEEETEGERTPEEIAEEIMKTVEIERLELPSQNTQRSR